METHSRDQLTNHLKKSMQEKVEGGVPPLWVIEKAMGM